MEMTDDPRLADAKPRGFERQLEAYGDRAVIVVLGDNLDIAVNRKVHRLAAAVGRLRSAAAGEASPSADRRLAVIGRPVAGFATLLVPFDPEAIDGEEVRALVVPLLEQLAEVDEPATPNGEPLRIAVRYGGDGGPDLAALAELHGLRPADVVELHSSTTYEV